MATEYKLSYTASEIDEKLGKIDENTTNIGKLSEDIADLKENGTGGGNGATTAQANSLWAIIRKSTFAQQLTDAELNDFKTSWGISGEVEPDIPDEPIEPDNPEVTLTSISATYTGGDVVVGTSVNSLTGITVKAHYSDGTSKTVTGYTLSGTIVEGSNTITVSYGGKTTTFTVTGVAESGGEEPDIPYEPLYTLESADNIEVLDRHNKTDYPAYFTITNGNHVKFETENPSKDWYLHVNISSLVTNGQNTSALTETWFTVPANANFELKVSNILVENFAYNANTNHLTLFGVGGTVLTGVNLAPLFNGSLMHGQTSINVTGTTTEEWKVSSLAATIGRNTEGLKLYAEFDVEFWVNGMRWI